MNLNLSSRESLSNSVMEGMMQGRPSIVTDVGGNTELVRHNVEGRVVPYGEVEKLVSEMVFLMNNRDTAVGYGTMARERIEQHFTMKVMVQKTKQLIDSVNLPSAEQPTAEALRSPD